jgi:hypothetical protein
MVSVAFMWALGALLISVARGGRKVKLGGTTKEGFETTINSSGAEESTPMLRFKLLLQPSSRMMRLRRQKI